MQMIRSLIIAALALALVLAHPSFAAGHDGVLPRIDGRPALLLAGELGNSSAACEQDIDSIFPRLREIGLNAVLVPAYWDLLEPDEGRFDFSLTDHVMTKARENGLHVVFLWFGAWKNSMSCYAPAWFKRDYERFPRAKTESGKPLEIASAFSENVFQADCKAFTTWLKHVVENDKVHGTVVMIQIENEIGMLESARDYSEAANRMFAEWLKSNEPKGSKPDTDERFMAEHYARYVERLAQEARKLTDIPLYVNAALNSRGRKPGEYPSAGPLAHLKDIWKRHAPTVDFMSPDIYDSGYKSWVAQYAFPDNPLFIPEIRRDENCGAKAFYAFGEKDALGFSPFSIEDSPKDTKLRQAYGCLSQLSPYILRHRGTDAMSGVLFDQADRDTTIISDNLSLRCAHFFTLPWDSRATDGSVWPEGGGLIIRLAPMEYLVAGSGIVVTFDGHGANAEDAMLGEDGFALAGDKSIPQISTSASQPNATSRVGILCCDQVSVSADGTLSYIRRLNGDQDHQGRHVRIGVDDFQILHVKLYEYK